jgi:hypothetical protein
MSTSLFYHGFDIRGYRYVRTEYVEERKRDRSDFGKMGSNCAVLLSHREFAIPCSRTTGGPIG